MAGRRDSNPFDDEEVNPFAVIHVCSNVIDSRTFFNLLSRVMNCGLISLQMWVGQCNVGNLLLLALSDPFSSI